MGMELIGPILLFDRVISAGVQAPIVIGPQIALVGLGTVALTVAHGGLGAAAAGTIEKSMDGVNWVDAEDLTLTAAGPVILALYVTGFGFPWLRVVITNGGATGGRVTIYATTQRGEE